MRAVSVHADLIVLISRFWQTTCTAVRAGEGFSEVDFLYMIFDVSDAEAKRVVAGHHRRDDGLRHAVSRP